MSKKSNELVLEKPHPAQQLVLNSKKRFKVDIAGRRHGKTFLGKLACFRALFTGKKAAWFSPTHKMYTHIFREVYEKLEPYLAYSNIQDKFLLLKNGASLQFWSAENVNSIRGQSYDLAVLDEAAYYKNSDIWQAAIRPTLADRQGEAYFLTTPNGRNYIYELYVMGQDKLNPEFESWRFPSYVSPFFDINEYRNAKLTMPERIFEQEYNAEFLLNSGEVFKNIDQVCKLPYIEHPYEGRFVFGIDFARSNDYTVVVCIDTFYRIQVDMLVVNQIRYIEIVNEIKSFYEKWKPHTVIAEANSTGDALIEMMEDKGIPVERFVTGNKSKNEIILSLALNFEKKNILLLNEPEMIRQLQAYQIKLTETGKAKYSGAYGYHDDMVIALALANYAMDGYSGVFSSKIPRLG